MPYGTIKVDNITFTNGGSDTTITVSGLASSTTGNLTVTGTISGAVVRATTVSGVTVTGTTVQGASGTFTSITGGVATITSGVFAAGSATTPSISFTGDDNTGIYSPGADQVAVATNGTGRLFVDASGNIKVSTGEIFQTSASSYIRLDGGTGSGNGANVIVFGESHGSAPGRVALTAIGTGAILASTGGSERLRITSAGLVGIGTSSPTTTLDVAGNARLHNSTSNTNRKLEIRSTQGYSSFIQFTEDNIADRWSLGIANGDGGFIFKTGADFTGTERLRITSAGNVGIGTQSPSDTLHVVGSSSTAIFEGSVQGAVAIKKTGTNGVSLISPAAGVLQFYDNNSSNERARITSSGQLLVGTSSSRSNFYNSAVTINPALQIEGASSNQFDNFRCQSFVFGHAGVGGPNFIFGKTRSNNVGQNTVVSSGDEIATLSFQGADGTDLVEAAQISCFVDGTPGANDMPGRLVFSTTADGASSPTERMRITSAGNVNFGAESSGYWPVEVPSGSYAIRFKGAGSNYGGQIGSYNLNSLYLDGYSNVIVRGGAVNGNNNGLGLAAGATSWASLSDERFKTDLIPIRNGLNKVSSLRSVTGRYKTDEPGTSRSFLIAQDVKEVLPEAVDDSNLEELQLRITEVIPLLVAAIKESKERIETLEAEVAALKGA